MTHKARIDLVPPSVSNQSYWRVCNFAAQTVGTVARSLDDAFNLIMQSGDTESELRVWNFGYFNEGDRSRVTHFSQSYKTTYWQLDGDVPYITDVVDQLATGTEPYGTRSLEKIRYCTIHHTVGWSYPDDNLRSIQAIAAYHVNTRGWPGIAYHFIIAPNGQIYKVNELETWSYHAGSYAADGDENEVSFAITLGGDFTYSRPTTPQLYAARAMVWSKAHNNTQLQQFISILGHRHMPGAGTACPGATFDNWLPFVAGYKDWYV